MLKNILLVGGSGYLGRHLRKHLAHRGYSVSWTGSQPLNEPNYFQVDFDRPESYNSLSGQQFEVVVVLAARLNSISTTDFNHPDLSVNTLGYGTFLQYLKDHSLSGKIIYTSSMTVYSSANKSPVTEDAEIGPLHTYGLSKYLAECMTAFCCRTSTLNGVILRLPGIFGGDKKGGFIYNTAYNLKNGLPNVLSSKNLLFWETIHVDDLCDMITDFVGMYDWTQDIDIFNVCYGRETDFYETFNFIKSRTANEHAVISETEKGYIPFFLSNEKLKKLIPVRSDYFGKLAEYVDNL